MMEKLDKNLLGLVIGIICLTLFVSIDHAEGISDGLKSWSQKYNTDRFVVLSQFNFEAVLDKETQLVWEKSPNIYEKNWVTAIEYCYDLNLGGRGGWRLPTIEELRTLVDPSKSDPALPGGHPFKNVWSSYYWSSTTNNSNTAAAWTVYMKDGTLYEEGKAGNMYIWCVRGKHGYDAY